MKEIYGYASRDELYHYGVKGMKWRKHLKRKLGVYDREAWLNAKGYKEYANRSGDNASIVTNNNYAGYSKMVRYRGQKYMSTPLGKIERSSKIGRKVINKLLGDAHKGPTALAKKLTTDHSIRNWKPNIDKAPITKRPALRRQEEVAKRVNKNEKNAKTYYELKLVSPKVKKLKKEELLKVGKPLSSDDVNSLNKRRVNSYAYLQGQKNKRKNRSQYLRKRKKAAGYGGKF